jgi:adenosylmethionine-8-amino-7-oxononanoate aminotransferase
VVFAEIGETFVHGFTFSHHPAGAAAGLAVMKLLEGENLVEAAAVKGELLRSRLVDAIGDHRRVGDIRGRGLLVAVELVADRGSKEPYERSAAVTESLLAAARDLGLLLYPASKGVDGVNGDAVLIGPPLVISDDEIDQVVGRLAAALSRLEL